MYASVFSLCWPSRFVSLGWSFLALLFLLAPLQASQAAPPRLVAQAKDTDKTTNPDLLREAERLWKEGVATAKQEKYKEALAKFWASLRLVPESSENSRLRGIIHFFIGRTNHKMSRWSQARDHYRAYLKLQPNGSYKTKANEWLQQVLPKLKATIQLNTETANQAECQLTHPGGTWKGNPPASVPVESGTIQVHCEQDKYYPFDTELKVQPKGTQSTTIALKPKPIVVPPKMTPDLRWIGLVVGGVGLATLGGGGIVGFLAQSDYDRGIDARDNGTSEGSQTALQFDRSAQGKATTANVMYGVGGGLAIAGVILYLVLGPRKIVPKTNSTPKTQTAQDGASNLFLIPSMSPSKRHVWQQTRTPTRARFVQLYP